MHNCGRRTGGAAFQGRRRTLGSLLSQRTTGVMYANSRSGCRAFLAGTHRRPQRIRPGSDHGSTGRRPRCSGRAITGCCRLEPAAPGPACRCLSTRRRVPRTDEDVGCLTRLRRRGRRTGRRQTAVQHRQPVDLPCDPQVSVDRWDQLVEMLDRLFA